MEITRAEKVGSAGVYFSSCFFLSFCLPYVDLFRGEIKYEDTPGIVILANYFNCFIWYYYGKVVECSPIKLNNLVCYICSALLLFIYLVYEFRTYRADAVLNLLIIAILTFIIQRFFTIFDDDDDKIFMAGVCSLGLVYISPLALIYRVIKELNYNLIPAISAGFAMIGTLLWTFYALSHKPFKLLMIPNIIGFLISILQIYVYFNYKKKAGTRVGKQSKSQGNTIGVEETEEISGGKEKPVKIASTDK